MEFDCIYLWCHFMLPFFQIDVIAAMWNLTVFPYHVTFHYYLYAH